MKLTAYVASSLDNWKQAREVMNILREKDYEIELDWSAWLIKWLGEEWDKERDGEIDEVDPDDCFLQIEDKQCLTMMDIS